MSNIYTLHADFPGDQAELDANFASHLFIDFKGSTRCSNCDCRMSGAISQWPCGASVPTVTFVNGQNLHTATQEELQELWLNSDEVDIIETIQREFGRRADVREAAQRLADALAGA